MTYVELTRGAGPSGVNGDKEQAGEMRIFLPRFCDVLDGGFKKVDWLHTVVSRQTTTTVNHNVHAVWAKKSIHPPDTGDPWPTIPNNFVNTPMSCNASRIYIHIGISTVYIDYTTLYKL